MESAPTRLKARAMLLPITIIIRATTISKMTRVSMKVALADLWRFANRQTAAIAKPKPNASRMLTKKI